MTDLTRQRAEEAVRRIQGQYPIGKTEIQTALAMAEVIAENWQPPAPVNPDEAEVTAIIEQFEWPQKNGLAREIVRTALRTSDLARILTEVERLKGESASHGFWRIIEFFNKIGIGTGEDPIGFLLASHAHMAAQRNDAEAQRDALQAEVARLREGLSSIANNTCCSACREAALVARSFLNNLSTDPHAHLVPSMAAKSSDEVAREEMLAALKRVLENAQAHNKGACHVPENIIIATQQVYAKYSGEKP